LTSIGAAHGMTWNDVYQANRDKISDPNKIYPGQVLTIPAKG
jgi:nucleoid-associated protein YgaU